jgi:MFS transporter, FSR family, fosmidomycin resistance protein
MSSAASSFSAATPMRGERLSLLYSSISHGLMHLMTAFYSVIVVSLALSWNVPDYQLLELYGPAAILLGAGALPAGWLSDRWSAPGMIVIMLVGMGVSSIACGFVPTGDTLALGIGLGGIGLFGSIYHSVGIGWVIRTASRQGHAMGVNGLFGSAGLALYGIFPAALISLHSWRAAFIVPGLVCLGLAVALWWHWRKGAVGDRQMPATSGVSPGRDAFWRVFIILSITMFVEGVQWQAMIYGAGLLFSGRLAGEIESIRSFFGRYGVETQVVLWVGLATSTIYVLSGIAQYVIGNRVLDRYRLKTIYVIATGLGAFAMLMVAEGSGLVVLAGAVFAAILSSATGPVENLIIARYTPSRFHGLGFGAKFVIAFGVGWLAIKLIAAVKARTGDLDVLFLGLAIAAVAMCLVSLLLPGSERRNEPAAVAQPAE